jgi:phage repressor protein C with HTH and peptisase S24 domain
MRVFQISGDSMLPIPDGAYIICEKVESLSKVKEGKRHIVVTTTEGIVYKRIYLYEDKLRLVSDNAVFSPFEVHLGDVRELWKTVGFILPDEE